jgi:hypothetical protein
MLKSIVIQHCNGTISHGEEHRALSGQKPSQRSRIWQKPQTCNVAYSVTLLLSTEGGFTGQRMQLEPHAVDPTGTEGMGVLAGGMGW